MRVHHAGSPVAGFELASAPVPRHLRPFIESWTGYREWSPSPVRRLEYPTGRAVLIFEFGAPIAVDHRTHRLGFFAGAGDAASLTEFSTCQAGVQVTLTPRGALAVGTAEMQAFAREAVSLDSLEFPSHVVEALAEATSWERRFRWVTRALERRFVDGPALSPITAWALARIDAASGSIEIGQLAEELGFSRKHLHQTFAAEVGLAPKRYAGIRRFARVVERLREGDVPLASLALQLGYADQAHLGRDVRRFSGLTPTALKHAATDAIALAIQALTARA